VDDVALEQKPMSEESQSSSESEARTPRLGAIPLLAIGAGLGLIGWIGFQSLPKIIKSFSAYATPEEAGIACRSIGQGRFAAAKVTQLSCRDQGIPNVEANVCTSVWELPGGAQVSARIVLSRRPDKTLTCLPISN
jgi:hypothetical protein